jgi:hypothetical protein
MRAANLVAAPGYVEPAQSSLHCSPQLPLADTGRDCSTAAGFDRAIVRRGESVLWRIGHALRLPGTAL